MPSTAGGHRAQADCSSLRASPAAVDEAPQSLTLNDDEQEEEGNKAQGTPGGPGRGWGGGPGLRPGPRGRAGEPQQAARAPEESGYCVHRAGLPFLPEEPQNVLAVLRAGQVPPLWSVPVVSPCRWGPEPPAGTVGN